MRYADGPSTSASIEIEAPPAAVWALVSDIELPARFSTEFQGARWLDDERRTFSGRNQHPAIGEWDTVSTVVEREPERVFAWAVSDPENPSATWRFSLEPLDGGGRTRLTQSMRMGPARSGLNAAIDAMPDKEERIVARRLEEHRANMERTLTGIKELAESQPAAS